MTTPNLTQLNNFYARLILQEVAKDENCTKYKNSWEVGDNCSEDGYLMVKTLELPDEDQPVAIDFSWYTIHLRYIQQTAHSRRADKGAETAIGRHEAYATVLYL